MTHTASSVSTRFRTRPALRLFTCSALAFGLLAHSTLAQAFCRTTTCNANLEDCGEDEAGCMVAGAPLFVAKKSSCAVSGSCDRHSASSRSPGRRARPAPRT